MVQRTKIRNSARNGLVTAIDVGSTKIACFIGQSTTEGGIEIVGIGHQLAQGMRNGNIIDMDAVEHSIRMSFRPSSVHLLPAILAIRSISLWSSHMVWAIPPS